MCFLSLVFFSVAAAPSIKYLSIDQGLSNNSVRCIYQDHNGFMWFGTYDGLNRYDGYEFKVFRNKLNDTTSLPHNYIYTINEDQHNCLWVGTGQGIAKFNNLTGSFSPAYYLPYGTNTRRRITINATAIQPDTKGNVLIATNGQGLLIQRAGTETATQIPFANQAVLATEYNIPAMAIDAAGRCWLFINQVGLCRYDYKSHSIKLVSNVIKAAAGMVCDNGGIWIGGNTGLYQYNIASGTITENFTEQAGNLTSNSIASLYLDKQKKLWIGTEGGGVNILNTGNDSFTYLQPSPNGRSLSSESVFSIYEDKNERKWIGTLKGGIDVIEPGKQNFQTIKHQPLEPNSLVNDFVSCFFEDANKDLWIGTDGGGMSIWNRQQNKFTNYNHQPANPSSLSNNLVTSIRQDGEGNNWITTFGGGINKFNRATGTFQQYHCYNPQTGVENKNAWLLYEDRQKTLWATTFSQGALYRYNRPADRFESFAPGAIDLVSFMEDAAGQLWGGNSASLVAIDKSTGKHVDYAIGKPVRAIYEDATHNLWLGTEGGGLILFNRKTGSIEKRYSAADGLCNNSVLTILEDNKGYLWLSTFNGLSRFNPADKSFKNFYQSDGLQSNQFLYSAALKLQSGELAFGGIKGFTIFNPDSLQFANTIRPIRLTSLLVNGEPITTATSYITQTSGDLITALRIPYDKAILSFDFATLEFSVPNKISYAYYLDGWDKTWNYTGNIRTASYTRLREGTYTLHIKATNARGDWNPEQTLLTVVIQPPWYRSWWAYLIYLSIIASLIYLYNGYRVRQAKLEYEVKLASANAEKEKELNEKKLSFFTDISHEFRTPLTLIINPLKDSLSGGKNAAPADLNLVYRNANRLLNLVDQLLQFQKAGSGSDEVKIARINFCSLCREVYESFAEQAQRKNIDYQFYCADGLSEMYVDKDKIEIVFFNLLSNAMKFTPVGGSIRFAIEEKQNDIEINITDSGPGIPEGVGDKLFERFYQVKEARSSSKPGFGIGLYLVKHFVDLHKGSIRYQSQSGTGTTFTVSLLKGKTHFDAHTVVETEEISPSVLFTNEHIPAPVAQPEKEKPEREELVSGKQSILVVEDDADIRKYIQDIFREKYNVYEAENGEVGIQLAKDYLPDLIVSDVMMPNATGIELCNAVKQDVALSHIPVILLTAASASDMKLKGLESGADDYITKPFEKELLVARVVNLLKKRTTLQNYFYNEVTLQQNTQKVSAEYKEFLEKCIAIVEAHLDDEQFSIKTLSKEIGMSHSNLYKKVKSISGQSVNSFIRFIRLRKAAELFINTDKNVNETAFEVGMNDIKYFREQFNKLFGMNPSEYIKKYRKAFGSNYRVNRDAFGES